MASEPLLSSSITYPVIRETFHSNLPFVTVISNLYSSIGKSDALKWPSIVASITACDESSKENFIKEVEAAVGPEGFMNFGEFNHSHWLPLFAINTKPQLGLKRIILGNPLIAITMLSQSSKALTAGLFVPVEILVRELSDGKGTEVVWQRPSTMIYSVDGSSEGLLAAAKALDGKLEELVKVICGNK